MIRIHKGNKIQYFEGDYISILKEIKLFSLIIFLELNSKKCLIISLPKKNQYKLKWI